MYRYVVPSGDFASYLEGTWKRNLEWRHFGGSYQHLRVSNTVVVIQADRRDEQSQQNQKSGGVDSGGSTNFSGGGSSSGIGDIHMDGSNTSQSSSRSSTPRAKERDSATKVLRWSFGSAKKSDGHGQGGQASINTAPGDLRFGYSMKFIPDTKGTFMTWEHKGNRCHGMFQPMSSVAVLNFYMQTSTVTITYRVMDVDTMAVCIVEVDQNHRPTVQYGNMCRISATPTLITLDKELAVKLNDDVPEQEEVEKAKEEVDESSSKKQSASDPIAQEGVCD